MKPWEKLRDYLQAPESDVAVVSRSEAEVVAVEQRYGVRLPKDYRDFLLHAAPVRDDDWDSEHGSWWSPGRVRNMPDELPEVISDLDIAREAPMALYFLDHMFWCWAWVICCGEGPNRGRIILSQGPPRFVADSFAEFVDRYIDDWISLS